MRLLFTSILALFFIAAFCAFFLLTSIVGFVDSPDRLVSSAQKLDIRNRVVKLSASYIAKKVTEDPSLENMSEEQLQVIIAGVITESWVEESLITVHAGLKGAIRGAEENAILDLRPVKESMRNALASLKNQASKNCIQLLGADVCADADVSQEMIGAFEQQAIAAIRQIEDEVSLLGDLKGNDRRQAEHLREVFESLETMRMLAMLLLILSLAGILALNSKPISRMFRVTGLVAMLASGIYLLAIAVSNRIASEELVILAGAGGPEELRDFSRSLVGELAAELVSGSTMPVSLIGICGGISVALVFFLGRRAY